MKAGTENVREAPPGIRTPGRGVQKGSDVLSIFFLLFKIWIQLTHNVTLVSDVQCSDSTSLYIKWFC